MLSEMNGKDSKTVETRYSRSQSDCNGRMQSVYTESKHVSISKQVHIPINSTHKYISEVTITNGSSENSERTKSSPSPKKVVKVISNGQISENLALAKEVGNGETKSLVQQRIESLYGKCTSEEIKLPVKHSNKREVVNRISATENASNCEKSQKASVSPPVFRHLNKDFRKQLQCSGPCDKKLDTEKQLKHVKKVNDKPLIKKNGHVSVPNGISQDECDRAKSKTPPPKLSDLAFDKKSFSKEGAEEREGYKYLNMVDCEKEKIQLHVKNLEEELKHLHIPEEASGKIRAACGKANLLMSQKFEQFKGLCWKNIEDDPNVPFYTTASDLAGFWDLVMLQIDDIHSTFKEIEIMKHNGWKEIVSQKNVSGVKSRSSSSNSVSRSNPSTPKKSGKSAELAKAREEARKQLLAAKKRGRQQNTVGDAEVAIFTSAPS